MGKKIWTIIIVALMIGVLAAVVGTTYAWYARQSKAGKSLDYVVKSQSIVTFELSQTDSFARMVPAIAKKGAVAAGKTDISNVFVLGSNMESCAEIGVASVEFTYFGTDGDSGQLSVTCGTVAESVDGREVDANADVSYMVCARGDGFVLSPRWAIAKIPGMESNFPDTTCWIARHDSEDGYAEYEYTSGFYLLNTNVSHDQLYSYFGIDNYVTVCSYDDELGTYTWNSSEFNTELFVAAMEAAVTANHTRFIYNETEQSFVIQKSGNDYTVILEDTVGRVSLGKEVQLRLLVFVWYNKVDELIDPIISEGNLNVQVNIDTNDD